MLIVEVHNPQGLPIAHEHVRLDWTGPNGQTRSKSHDFDVNGSLGTFTIQLAHESGGRLRVAVDLSDATRAPIGRTTKTVALSSSSRTNVELLATRLLSAGSSTLLAGVPGGNGDRDGPTGADPTLAARFDRPLAFSTVAFFKSLMEPPVAFVLEECGAIRRVRVTSDGGFYTDTFLPCSRHTPQATSGSAGDLSLDHPSVLVGDPFGRNLYIGDGNRVVAIEFSSVDAPASNLTYFDFTALSGVSLHHVADLRLGPYFQTITQDSPHYTTLYAADDVDNVVYAFPLSGGAPTVVAGAGGACVSPLPAAERARWSDPWSPGPFVAPTQAHLCRPNRLDTAAIGGMGSDPVLLISDAGNGAMRMLAPNGRGAGQPGVTTLFDGYPSGISAFGYHYLAPNTLVPGTEIGALFFWSANQLGYLILFSNPPIPGFVGRSNPITTNPIPGYTARFNLPSAVSSGGLSGSPQIQFDDVNHVYRVSDGEQGNSVTVDTYMVVVQRGNSTVSHVDLSANFAPWMGGGPSRGRDRAAANPASQPTFAQPLGVSWDGAAGTFVADHDNHAIARLSYDGSARPLNGLAVEPLVGCPGTPGHVDGSAAGAQLRGPTAVAWDAQGSALYVVDGDGTYVRRLVLDGTGSPTEIHTLFAPDASDSASCDGGVLDAGIGTPGLLRNISSLVLDPTRRVLWIAHADSPDLAFFDVDAAAPTPELLALPGGSTGGAQLAIVDVTLYAVDPAGHLSTIDLLDAAPTAQHVGDLALSGVVTAVGTDGEWLYVADASARLWRLDPQDSAYVPQLLAGDGSHGLLVGGNSGFNRVGGISYDLARGVLLLSDSAENAIVALQ